MKFALRQVLSETVGDDASASRKTQGKYNCDTLYEVTSIDGYAATFPKGESKPQREKQAPKGKARKFWKTREVLHVKNISSLLSIFAFTPIVNFATTFPKRESKKIWKTREVLHVKSVP